MVCELASESRPNPAVKADAPSAGLRPRHGSPVTLIRWASIRLSQGSHS